jgi:hypothetical protein
MTNWKYVMRWAAMMDRCYNKEHASYPKYGGRGIKVCTDWHDYRNYAKDIGEIPVGMSVDRVDNDGNYELDNIRFANALTQSNNRSFNVKLTLNGKTQNVSQWAAELGFKPQTLWSRLNRENWDPEKALLQPLKSKLFLTHAGKTQSAKQWSREMSLPYSVIVYRRSVGWDDSRILTTKCREVLIRSSNFDIV